MAVQVPNIKIELPVPDQPDEVLELGLDEVAIEAQTDLEGDERLQGVEDVFRIVAEEEVELQHMLRMAVTFQRFDLHESFEVFMGKAMDFFRALQLGSFSFAFAESNAMEAENNERTRQHTTATSGRAELYLHLMYINLLLMRIRGLRGTVGKDAEERLKLMGQTTRMLNHCDTLAGVERSKRNVALLATKGVYFLTAGQTTNALGYFTQALKESPKLIVGHLGRALCFFGERKYSEALKSFQFVLRHDPQGKADPRLGIGLCYAKLKKPEEAKTAFERVQKLAAARGEHEGDVAIEALVQLGILDLNKFKSSSLPYDQRTHLLKSGFDQISRAYKQRRKHPLASLMLAEVFLVRADETKVEAFVKNVMEAENAASLLGSAYHLIARYSHFRGDFIAALESYEKAKERLPDNPAVLFGLGQCYLQKNDYRALETFEAVLRLVPDCIEALKILADKHGERNQADLKLKATEYFDRLKRAFKVSPSGAGLDQITDAEILVAFGKSFEDTDSRASLTAYTRALEILEQRQEGIPAELWNNIGSLEYQVELGKAREKLLKADAIVSKEIASGMLSKENAVVSVAVKYNLGRVFEMTGDKSKAVEVFDSLLQKHPGYIDARLRLAVLRPEKSLELLEETITLHPSNVSAHILLSTVQLARKELKPARRTLEKVFAFQRNDVYSHTLLGNIWLELARKAGSSEDKTQTLNKAFLMFDTALKFDQNNIFAAIGLACVFAEKGSFAEARVMLQKIHNRAEIIPAAAFNLAHVCVELENYDTAITLYELCIQKHYGCTDIAALHALARAYYYKGKVQGHAKSMLHCLKLIQKCIHMSNRLDGNLFYDLAVSCHTFTNTITTKDATERTDVHEIKKADSLLDLSTKIFRSLKEDPRGLDGKPMAHPWGGFGWDRKQAGLRENFTGSLKKVIEKTLKTIEVKDQERAKQIKEIQSVIEEEKARTEQVQVEGEARREEERKRIETVQRELNERFKEEETKILEREKEKEIREGAKGGKRKRKEREGGIRSDDEALEETNGAGDDGESRKKKKKKKALVQLVEESDKDEDLDDGSSKKIRKKYLSKVMVESDDEVSGAGNGDDEDMDADQSNARPSSTSSLKKAFFSPASDDEAGKQSDALGSDEDTKKKKRRVVESDEDD